MNLAEQAASSPRTRFGMARRSLWNTSFPESFRGAYAIRFVRPQFGRVPLDVHERVPPERLSECIAEIVDGSNGAIGPRRVRNLLIDAEAGVYHWAADNLSPNELDITTDVQRLVSQLSDVLESIHAIDKAGARAARLIINSTSPDIRKALWRTDELDPVLLRAAVSTPKRGRRPGAPPPLTALINGLLDDWKRRTGLHPNQATSPGSARHLFSIAFELMATHPSASDGSEIRGYAAKHSGALRTSIDKPLANALKRAAEPPRKRPTEVG